MKFSKLTLSIAIVTVLSSGQSFGASSEKSNKLHEQALDYKIESDTITEQAKIDKAKKKMVVRDGFRDVTVMSNLERDAKDSTIGLVSTKMELKKEQFILDNVPPEVMISGRDAVVQYIENNFVNNSANSPKEASVSKIWGSTDKALSIPNYSEWEPEVKAVPVPMPTYIPAPIPEIKKATVLPVSSDERQAMAELGLSQDEIDSLLGKNSSDKTEAQKKSEKEAENDDPNEVDSNVIIDKIEVSRAVIMGELTRANVKIEVMVIRGSQKKKVIKSFEQIKPGFLFEIDGTRFEFSKLTKTLVVFENLDNQKTYRTLLN